MCDPDMVACPSTRKTEASRVSDQPGLQRQFRASLRYIGKPHLKNNKPLPDNHKPSQPNQNIEKIICLNFSSGAFYQMRVLCPLCLLWREQHRLLTVTGVEGWP